MRAAGVRQQHDKAVKTATFSYDIVSSLAQNGGANTHFIVFDEKKKFWATLCPEFPFVVISRRASPDENGVLGRDQKYWADYFNKHLAQAARLCSTDFLEIVKKTYIPRALG